jgi:hypothetical protein
MGTYKVWMSDKSFKHYSDAFMKNDNNHGVRANSCENIERLLNQDDEIMYYENLVSNGELHSVIPLIDPNTDDPQYAFIFKKNTTNVDFLLEGKSIGEYELCDKDIDFITKFKKFSIDEKTFEVDDIYYNIDEKKINVIVK